MPKPPHKSLHIATNKKPGSQPTRFMAFQPSDPARASAVPRWTWAQPLTNDMDDWGGAGKCSTDKNSTSIANKTLKTNKPTTSEPICLHPPSTPYASGQLAHCSSTQKASTSAATPGNTLPTRSSRLAPPPVEMCAILGASSDLFTADTESPPPMMVMAPFFSVISARHSAIS